MRYRNDVLASFIIIAQSATAHAGTVPDIVQSDEGLNTAGGTDALYSLVLTVQSGGGNPIIFGGTDNTAFGASALVFDTYGNGNTAVGAETAGAAVTANYNSAFGALALFINTGDGNTAVGYSAMSQNISGNFNTAVGYMTQSARGTAGTGSNNSMFGAYALASTSTASSNTALGGMSMLKTTSGSDSTAVGYQSLYSNTSGGQNTATGMNALRNSTVGNANVGSGYSSCWSCRDASNNVGVGFKTLYLNESGSDNVAIGSAAGYNITGSFNIDIGNLGTPSDAGVIRIGAASTHKAVYIAGIGSSQVTGAAVYVNSDGQLGVLASSERYKTAIQSIADTAKLQQLRPVSYRLKSEPQAPVQYGLIAEEVDRVYPELVIRDGNGTIQGVRYEELTALLLHELQNERQERRRQQEEMSQLRHAVDALRAQNEDIRTDLVAQRNATQLAMK